MLPFGQAVGPGSERSPVPPVEDGIGRVRVEDESVTNLAAPDPASRFDDDGSLVTVGDPDLAVREWVSNVAPLILGTARAENSDSAPPGSGATLLSTGPKVRP